MARVLVDFARSRDTEFSGAMLKVWFLWQNKSAKTQHLSDQKNNRINFVMVLFLLTNSTRLNYCFSEEANKYFWRRFFPSGSVCVWVQSVIVQSWLYKSFLHFSKVFRWRRRHFLGEDDKNAFFVFFAQKMSSSPWCKDDKFRVKITFFTFCRFLYNICTDITSLISQYMINNIFIVLEIFIFVFKKNDWLT